MSNNLLQLMSLFGCQLNDSHLCSLLNQEFNTNRYLRQILSGHLIVDLHNLAKKVAYKRELRLIYNCLTTAYLREALNREEPPSIQNMFVADEAQLLVPRTLQKVIVTDTWVTTDFATRLRKRGESLVIISQSPSNIEDDIRKNAHNVFVFGLQDPKDIRAIAGMLGYMQIDEVTYMTNLLTNLENRRAIIKTPLANNPFSVRSLHLELEKIGKERLKQIAPEVDQREELGEDELELLKSIEVYPFIQNTERAYHLGWPRSRFSKVRKSLLQVMFRCASHVEKSDSAFSW